MDHVTGVLAAEKFFWNLADTFIQSDLQMRTFKIYKNVYF